MNFLPESIRLTRIFHRRARSLASSDCWSRGALAALVDRSAARAPRLDVISGFAVAFMLVGGLLRAAAAAQSLSPEQLKHEAFLFTPAGFDRAGQPVWAGGEKTGQLQIIVRDAATGQVTPCRVNVVGPDGNFYQPPVNRLSPYALTGQWPKPNNWGNRIGKAPYRYVGRFFYTTGESTVPVPAGTVRVEVWKGLEYRPETITAQISAGATQRLDVHLTRAAPMAAPGYYAGDSHLHFRRETEEQDQIMFDLLEAEDFRYGCALTYNEPAGPYAGVMSTLDYPQRLPLGRRSIRTRGNYHIISGQEYRSSTYGHLNLYLLDDLVFPGRKLNANVWPVYGEVGRETMGQGGFAMMAHGGYGLEVWADAALGTINAVELLQFGVYRGIELEGWYNMLSAGYRFPAAAACDYPPCRTLADCRTYAYHPTAPTMPEWIAAVSAGRSFFTTGPLVLLEVDGEKPGAQIRRSGNGPHQARVSVRVRCEVTPVTDIELIVNGRVVEHRTVPRAEGQGRWIELARGVALTESSWIAARAYSNAPIGQPDAEAHTNPVFVYLNNRAPFQRAAIDGWVARIDQQIATHTQRQFAERAKVLAYFQRARDLLLKIRAQGGLAADADPAKLAAGLVVGRPGIRDLAVDGSITDPTAEEMKAFLQPVPPKPPAEALTTFETPPGFRLELVAAEPMVYDPIAAAFDEDGNLYVAEMRDYPYNGSRPVKVAWQKNQPQPGGKPLGTVRLLRDTDGDGRFDQSVVFADGLLWAGGIMPWKGGVFVASSPDIWYLKDTDGDGRADIREKVFTGFGIENQQGMVNSLIYGLDHRIYGSTSVNGGEIRPGHEPAAKPISIKGRDFRFDPFSRHFEPQTGTKQFGMSFDDWGNRFLCSQSQPALHVVLPLHYLERNPHFTPPATIYHTTPPPTPLHRISPIERWRHIRSSRRVAGSERAAGSAGVSHHVVDAGAGITVYRGGAYPKEYYGNLFLGDSVSNLVHRRALVPDGATFRTERVDAGTEFVRSSDIWFRPVNFVNAPDGTLYCLDMAREYSETINIPADVEQHLDLTSGRDYGRIYRIAPPGFRSPPPPRLSRANASELVRALESPHGWWRETAHRLLHERQDKSVVPALRQLAVDSRSPQARVHALWALQGLQALGDREISSGLSDPHPGVRENAIRLAEPRLEAAEELREKILALVSDPEPRVRLQIAFTIGESRRWDQAALLARLARENLDDPWIQSAILSSVGECGGDLFAAVVADPNLAATARSTDFLRQLVVVIGAQNRAAEVARTIETLAGSPNTGLALPLVGALGEGLKRAGTSLGARDPGGRIKALLRRAPQLAADSTQPESLRRAAIGSLGLVSYAEAAPTLLALLEPKQPATLQLAAISTFAQFRDPQVGPALLERYAALNPAGRARALDAILERAERVDALMSAIEGKSVGASDLSAKQVDFLRQHRDARVRERVTRLLGAANPAARQDVHAAFLPALQLAGVGARGKALFESRCAVCHAHAGLGHEFGPDLTAVRTGGREKLLTSIVDPNREVLPQYFICTVETKDGESIGGIVRNETATTVTLRQPGGIERTLARASIATMKTTGQSFMPEGLEAGLSHQDLADLFEFLFEPGR
jgi:putative membrane-bound dehydrogenase-like protein